MTTRILFSAFSCLPNRGSEPGVGWNWAVQAAYNDNLEVFVLTREKCRAKIEPIRKELGLSNLSFIYVPSSARLRKISIYLEYISWEYSAYRYVLRNFGPEDFDCLWHITFGNVFLPIWTYRLPYKFIWGPMGGGEYVPRRFYKEFGLRNRLPHAIKNVLVKIAKYNPIVQNPAKAASLILARTEDTKAVLARSCWRKVELTLETRMDISSLPASSVTLSKRNIEHDDGRISVCYTGRLIALKNVDKLVRAVVSLIDEGVPVSLHLIGEGPMLNELQMIAGNHANDGTIVFHGRMSREDTLQTVASCEIFAFPSLKEGGAWSLMEAMALGRAIICFDGSGMHEMTTDECAFRIPMKEPSDVEGQFKAAIKILIEDPDLRSKLGKNARRRVSEKFGWNEARDRIKEVVRQVCADE